MVCIFSPETSGKNIFHLEDEHLQQAIRVSGRYIFGGSNNFGVGGTALHFISTCLQGTLVLMKPLGALFFPSPKKLPKRIANAKGYEAQMAIVNDKRNKLYTALWKFTYFTLCAVMGIVVCSSESWIFSQKDYFQGWPNHPIRYI